MSTALLMTEPVGAGPGSPSGSAPDRAAAAASWASTLMGADAERVLLDAAALRRRQLCVAFLHGSARSWRVRRRIWPAALAGLLLVIIAVAALAVAAAFARQQELDREGQSQSTTESHMNDVDNLFALLGLLVDR